MTDTASACFELADATIRDQVARPTCGPCCSIAIVGSLLLVSACVLGWSPPDWVQPSIVGLLWANLFLLGIATGNVRRGSAGFACLAGGLIWLSQIALSMLTHLSASECLLLATTLCAAGWSIAHLDNVHRPRRMSYSIAIQYRQWTIWDLAILTTFVAVICCAAPKLQSPAALLLNVACGLAGGVMCSWMAYRWVFDDQWNVVKLLAILSACALCLWFIARHSPAETSFLQLLA